MRRSILKKAFWSGLAAWLMSLSACTQAYYHELVVQRIEQLQTRRSLLERNSYLVTTDNKAVLYVSPADLRITTHGKRSVYLFQSIDVTPAALSGTGPDGRVIMIPREEIQRIEIGAPDMRSREDAPHVASAVRGLTIVGLLLAGIAGYAALSLHNAYTVN